jgi:hypothetical protein
MCAVIIVDGSTHSDKEISSCFAASRLACPASRSYAAQTPLLRDELWPCKGQISSYGVCPSHSFFVLPLAHSMDQRKASLDHRLYRSRSLPPLLLRFGHSFKVGSSKQVLQDEPILPMSCAGAAAYLQPADTLCLQNSRRRSA